MRTPGSVGEKTAERIRAKSLDLIARHGFAAVSMRMIADAVGVTPGTLYNHVPGKQALLVGLMQGHMDRLLQSWAEASAGSNPGFDAGFDAGLEARFEPGLDPGLEPGPDSCDDPVRALDHFARFHIRYHITRPDDVFVAYMELRALEAEGFARIEALRRRYEAIPKAIIRAGIAQGVFQAGDADLAAMALLAMLTGVNTWYRPGGRLSAGEIEEIYAAMALRSLGAGQARAGASGGGILGTLKDAEVAP